MKIIPTLRFNIKLLIVEPGVRPPAPGPAADLREQLQGPPHPAGQVQGQVRGDPPVLGPAEFSVHTGHYPQSRQAVRAVGLEFVR